MDFTTRPCTVADFLTGRYRLELYCRHCDLRTEAPLERLARDGWSRTPIARLRFRCDRCGGPTQRLIRTATPAHPPSGMPSPAPCTATLAAEKRRGTFPWNI